jgi:hypothetical protein
MQQNNENYTNALQLNSYSCKTNKKENTEVLFSINECKASFLTFSIFIGKYYKMFYPGCISLKNIKFVNNLDHKYL